MRSLSMPPTYCAAARHLLIIDNAESVTASAASIPHALSAAEQERLKTLLSRLRGGLTFVLIGSREAEEWLTAAGPAAGRYRLPGLDPQASSALVQRILAAHGADRYLRDPRERQALDDLMTLLGGYPLALSVVMPVLATAPPSAVLADLRAGGTSADPVGDITAAIEYSHGKLDPVIQNSLLLLAPFTGVIPRGPMLTAYQEAIGADPAVQRLGPIDLEAAVEHAVRVGLAGPYPPHTGFVQLQPVLPYFLRGKLRGSDELRKATDGWHYALCLNQSHPAIEMLDAQDDPERRLDGRAIVRAEYANFKAALDFGLRTGLRIGPIVEVLEEYLDQTEQPTARRALIDDAIAAHVFPQTRSQVQGLASLHALAGVIALQVSRPDEARQHHEVSLELYEAIGDKDGKMITLRNLGTVAEAEGDLAAAQEAYEQVLRMATESGDMPRVAGCHMSLGDIASDREQYDEARAHYQEALTIFDGLGQRHAMAGCLSKSADVAVKQGALAAAESDYQRAREIYAEFEDDRGVANATSHLGRLAERRHDLDRADALYRETLQLYFTFADPIAVGNVLINLASVASKRGRLAEAAANYEKALENYLEVGQRETCAQVCKKLAAVAGRLGLPDKEEARLRQGADLAAEAGAPGVAASIYLKLSMLDVVRGHHDQATADHRRAIDLIRGIGNEEDAARLEPSFGELADLVATVNAELAAAAQSAEAGDHAAAGRHHHEHAKLAERLDQFGVALAGYRLARDAFEAAGDTAGAADAYFHIGSIAMRNRDHRAAAESFERSAGLHVEAGERKLAGYRYDGFALSAQRTGRLAEAESGYQRGLELHLEAGDEEGAAQSRYGLALIADNQNHLDAAAANFNGALGYYRTADGARAAEILTQLGWIATRQGRHSEAVRLYNEAMKLAEENGSELNMLLSTYGLAFSAAALGRDRVGGQTLRERPPGGQGTRRQRGRRPHHRQADRPDADAVRAAGCGTPTNVSRTHCPKVSGVMGSGVWFSEAGHGLAAC